MEAVVMAAGEGRRLRPLSERYAKAVLPIDGRPVIVSVLRELVLAGARPITVVVGHLGDQVRALLAGFDAELRFATQPEPVVKPGSPNCFMWTTAGRSPMPLTTMRRSTRFRRASR